MANHASQRGLPATVPEWVAYTQTLHRRSIDMDLARVREVMNRMGLTRPAPRVICVAGTNGKGSSVAMLESIAMSAGLKAGAYTSPHLVHFNERVRIDAIAVDDGALLTAFAAVECARGDTTLTYFEFATLVAAKRFLESRVDIAILEVGLGGRLDAVRAFDSDIALITNVGIDHTGWLGPDREHIGREKAGIMRENGIAVCADRNPPSSLLSLADAIGVELLLIGRDFDIQRGLADFGQFSFRGSANDTAGKKTIDLPTCGIAGDHQLDNAAGVCATIYALGDSISVTDDQLKHGLSTAQLPGRLQCIDSRPRLLLDVAHNVDAAKALRAYIEAQAPDRELSTASPARIFAVFGMLQDKAVADVVIALDGCVDHWFLAGLAVERGLSAGELQAKMRSYVENARMAVAKSPVEALKLARRQANPDDLIVVFGSFHTVGDILAAENRR